MVLGWRRRKSNKTSKQKSKNGMMIINTNNLSDIEVPTHFICPISLDLMRDPVTVSTGITYERAAIESWLDSGGFTCPVTNQVLLGFDRVPNHALRALIQDWCLAEGADRVPTPRVPVHPAQASEALWALEASAELLDWPACAHVVAKIQDWGAEGERSRCCVKVNGAVKSLAKAFDFFAAACCCTCNDFDKFGVCSPDNNYIRTCSMILSVLSWMVPFRDHPEYEYASALGSESSLLCMVRLLSLELGPENVLAVLEEVTGSDEAVAKTLAGIEGSGEALIGVCRSRTSPRAIKSALSVVRNILVSRTHDNGGLGLVGSELVPLTLDLLVESDKVGITERALGVIEGLCGHEEGRARALENGLTIPILVKKLLRVSSLATELSVSAIWKLLLCDDNNHDNNMVSNAIVEALQVGAFQKLLVIIQVGCGDETKEKVTDLLKLLNAYRPDLECIESVDFKSLKRSF